VTSLLGTGKLLTLFYSESQHALQRTNAEKTKQIFPENELRGHSSSFYIYVSMSDLYIPMIDLLLLLQEYVHRSWEHINRSQTGLTPRNSKKRNTKMGFSLQCVLTIATGGFFYL
jgi:hypothetical protein